MFYSVLASWNSLRLVWADHRDPNQVELGLKWWVASLKFNIL